MAAAAARQGTVRRCDMLVRGEMSVYRDVLLGRRLIPLHGGLHSLMGPSESALNFTPASEDAIRDLPTAVVKSLTCTVCLETDSDVEAVRLPCGHDFHQECIEPWLLTNKVCPMCRHPVEG